MLVVTNLVVLVEEAAVLVVVAVAVEVVVVEVAVFVVVDEDSVVRFSTGYSDEQLPV